VKVRRSLSEYPRVQFQVREKNLKGIKRIRIITNKNYNNKNIKISR